MVGVQWSQFGHAMLRHKVADDEHADHHRPPNAVGGEIFKKRGASEPGQAKRCSSLTPVFENKEKGKKDYLAYMFLWLWIQSGCLARGCFYMS